jgi:hypothetical protein
MKTYAINSILNIGVEKINLFIKNGPFENKVKKVRSSSKRHKITLFRSVLVWFIVLLMKIHISNSTKMY